jgi:hypothetical protein
MVHCISHSFSWDGVRSGFGKAAISQQALNCTSWRLEGNVSRDIQHTTVDLIQARTTGGLYSRMIDPWSCQPVFIFRTHVSSCCSALQNRVNVRMPGFADMLVHYVDVGRSTSSFHWAFLPRCF